jgi:hypothetical protein
MRDAYLLQRRYRTTLAGHFYEGSLKAVFTEDLCDGRKRRLRLEYQKALLITSYKVQERRFEEPAKGSFVEQESFCRE